MKVVQLINTNANNPVVITKGMAIIASGSEQSAHCQHSVQRAAALSVSIPLVIVSAILVRDPLADNEGAQQHGGTVWTVATDRSFRLTGFTE